MFNGRLKHLCVQILRIRMYRETWLGEVGGAGSAAAAAATAAATATRLEDAPRAAHKQHSGEFRRLTVAAMPVHEGDSGFSDSEVRYRGRGLCWCCIWVAGLLCASQHE